MVCFLWEHLEGLGKLSLTIRSASTLRRDQNRSASCKAESGCFASKSVVREVHFDLRIISNCAASFKMNFRKGRYQAKFRSFFFFFFLRRNGNWFEMTFENVFESLDLHKLGNVERNLRSKKDVLSSEKPSWQAGKSWTVSIFCFARFEVDFDDASRNCWILGSLRPRVGLVQTSRVDAILDCVSHVSFVLSVPSRLRCLSVFPLGRVRLLNRISLSRRFRQFYLYIYRE